MRFFAPNKLARELQNGKAHYLDEAVLLARSF
jgi:hypothetical protein